MNVLQTLTFAIVFVFTQTHFCESQELPSEVEYFQKTIQSISGINDANITKVYLPEILVEDLSLPGFFADLPIAILRRSGGARKEELLITIDFKISRNEEGLKGLEFLAWWVRDISRAGTDIQLRAIGLSPLVGEQVRLGETLRFAIDWFYYSESQNMEVLLNEIGNLGKSLEESFKLHKDAFEG